MKPHEKKDSIMIFAPHPDDETLGCAGVIIKANHAGRRVCAVICSNGDGFAKAAALLSGKPQKALRPEDFLAVARIRQQGALKATRLLGVLPEDLFFLSYPDGGMAEMPNEVANPYTQPFTGKTETYGLLRPDYRSQISGRPAPYLRSSALDDSVELLRSVRPAEIYVTAEFDGHPDHRAWCVLIRQAAKIAEFRGKIFAYLIHSADGDWPTPRGVNPDMPFESHIINGRQVPADCPWPPSDRRPLPREESALKLRAIRCYDLEMRLAGTYVESFVKSEEIFWRIQADANSSLKKVRPDTQKT